MILTYFESHSTGEFDKSEDSYDFSCFECELSERLLFWLFLECEPLEHLLFCRRGIFFLIIYFHNCVESPLVEPNGGEVHWTKGKRDHDAYYPASQTVSNHALSSLHHTVSI